MTPRFPSRMLFTETAPCPRLPDPAVPPEAWPAASLLPPLAELDGEPLFAQVRAGWTEAALRVAITVPRHGPLTGNRRRPTSGDSLLLWVDARPGRRPLGPSRFCRQFIALPAQPGGGPVVWEQPLRGLHPESLAEPEALPLTLQRAPESYTLCLTLPWEVLGHRPEPEERLGFEYLITDTAAGAQSWATPRHSPAAGRPGRLPGAGGFLLLTP